MNNRLLKRFAAITTKIRHHEDDIKLLKEQLEAIEPDLIHSMVSGGIDSVTVDDQTIYIDRKLWASAGGDMPALTEALVAAGCSDLVRNTADHQRLSAWVREFDPEGVLSPDQVVALLPEPVRTAIKVTETTKLRLRKR